MKELQKLGKPPVYSGQEDELNEVSFVMKKLRIFVVHARSSVAGRCRRPREARHEYDENQIDHDMRPKHSAASTELHERNFQCKVRSVRGHSLPGRGFRSSSAGVRHFFQATDVPAFDGVSLSIRSHVAFVHHVEKHSLSCSHAGDADLQSDF